MASVTITTTVPPWVKIFASLNPAEVEIIEMTHPSITGFGKTEDSIEARMGESVFILRKCLTQQMVSTLQKKAVPTFPAIHAISSRKRTRVGTTEYHAWQAVRYQNCDCTYAYEGTTRHALYHNDPVVVDYCNVARQPESVSAFLQHTMDGIVNPLEEQDDFHHAKQHPLNVVILN